MKYDIKKLLGWFATASLLLTTSCVDASLDEIGSGLSDEVTVSFVLAPESAAASRAETDASNKPARISDGSKVDMLIYAVYDENDNLLLGYSDGADPELGVQHGEGQTIKKIDKFPATVNLTFKRGMTYKVAFWAQSSKTKAYNTADLKQVEVIYSRTSGDDNGIQTLDDDDNPSGSSSIAMPYNNDEMRDVFCRSVELTAGTKGSLTQNVYLYRPLAQINVGTTGYDYELVMRNANVKYTYSKIRINRVARYLNVVKDETITSTTVDGSDSKAPEAFAVVDFAYAPIPAYIDESFGGKAPDYPSYTKWDWEYAKKAGKEFNPTDDVEESTYEKEEFLYVSLDYPADEEANTPDNYGAYDDDGNDIGDGLCDYANSRDYNGKLTETFKYLSMCYVLTSSTKDEAVVINNIKVWLADENQENEHLLLDINHVPAQRNWRTNIVGNLLTEENTFEVKLDRNFAGEFNGELNPDEEFGATWSGPLADGVFYDAYNDEIQISNVNGLLWFQRMVNGDMNVREKYSNSPAGITAANIGDEYIYYKENEVTGAFTKETWKYRGIPAPDDEKLKERILVATKQKKNTNNDKENGQPGMWPKNKNFHFVGSDGEQATVALMADIDLSGIEWIPIGFDGRIAETVQKTFREAAFDSRGFFGIFKGNGHTIFNMSTKRFSANVPEEYMQSDNKGPYDNMQWFARGLFGQIGGSAKIDGVKLVNLDVYGCQCVGAVVGAAQGEAIEIINCVVDGGSLVVTPLYRADQYENSGTTKNRSFARGVYLGGIVGYFNTDGGIVEHCEVKNLYMRGYRRVGGIVGSVNPYELGDGQDTNLNGIRNNNSFRDSNPKSISYNKISNTVLLASQFSTFGMATVRSNFKSYIDNYGVIKIGFGWDPSMYNLYAHEIVGGHVNGELDSYISGAKFEGNDYSGLTFSEFTESENEDHKRVSDIQEVPLQYMPMLSAWYVDEVSLNSNYYGEPSAYTQHELTEFKIFSTEDYNSGYTPDGKGMQYVSGGSANVVKFPMPVPENVDVDWVKSSPRVGVYVGSVTINGKGIGGRSVITPTGVDYDGAAAMFVCPENRHQYNSTNANYKRPTVLNDLVIRGDPYAYTGILLAPNKNMNELILNNVAIYNVYQTLAAYDWDKQTNSEIWPNTVAYDAGSNVGNATITLNDCNLRGYTVPGPNWKSITYNRTTFERGDLTGHGELEYTCKVETNNTKIAAGTPAEISFDGCFFKAPYIIDMTDENNTMSNITFNECTATSASDVKWTIDITGDREGTVKIEILSNEQGDAVVKYYNAAGELLAQDGKIAAESQDE